VVALETYLSTEPEAAGEDARVPGAHENGRGPKRPEAAAAEEPLSPDSVRAGLASQGFPKIYRLRRRSEFRRVYDEGQRRSASLATVFMRANGLPHARLGITAPTHLGKAVQRNRVKRRVREFFRRHRTALPGGWDIVVNPRRGVAEIPFQALERELLRLFPAQAAPAPPKETP